MTYYIVKVIAKATDKNKNFKGETSIYYYGKGEEEVFNLNYAKEYGWKRRHFAERYVKEQKERDAQDKYHFWTYTYEIIEIEG